MAINQPIGYLCYNNADLVREGYIYQYLTKEYNLSGASSGQLFVWERRLSRKPPKGIIYTPARDENGKLIQVQERKRQLPADKIKVEIKFSKTMRNAITHPIKPGSIPSSFASGIIDPLFGGLGFGGVTQGTTDITYHLCDSDMFVNMPIIITEEIKETGIIKLNGYPLSVYAVVREWAVEGVPLSRGLQFTKEQLEVIGKYTAGSYNGIPRLKIDGTTYQNGRFPSDLNGEVPLSDVILNNQEDIFIEVPRDIRKRKFRADNTDQRIVSNPKVVSNSLDDITDKYMRLDVRNIKVGETVYATLNMASERRNRQVISHIGKVGQGSNFGVPSWTSEIGSTVIVFDYNLFEWKVPKLNPSFPFNFVDDDTLDSSYKLSFDQYQNEEFSTDILEGWRINEISTERVKHYWAADYRGILLISNDEVTILYHRSEIKDKGWFTQYLMDLDFTYPSGPDGTYYETDLHIKIDGKINMDDEQGMLYDISDINNTLLFDNEKIPYYRSFALALKNVSKYNKTQRNAGVGIPNLDLLENNIDLSTSVVSIDNVTTRVYDNDLSEVEFVVSEVRPRKTDSCAEPWNFKNYYECHIYNPDDKDPAYYSSDYIENQLLNWRPSGGTIESYWLLSTPYFCGDFVRDSRIYIEYVGGNSLNNFSMVYADTSPSVTSNISIDNSYFSDEAYLAFREENIFNSFAYNIFDDGVFESDWKKVKQDINKNNTKEEFNHDNYKIIGYNNMLGDFPSYSNGRLISNDFSEICYNPDNTEEDFYFAVNLLDTQYGLNFEDDIPTASFDGRWSLMNLDITYTSKENKNIPENERYISLYFEGSNTAINNISIPYSRDTSLRQFIRIDCAYYTSSPLQFLGQIWKEIDIISINGIVARDNRIDNYKMQGEQNAIIMDELGRIIMLFADEEKGNLSAVVSRDGGKSWYKFNDIIRLVEGEVASYPIIIKDRFNPDLHLFYVLNDRFLMYMRLDTNNLVDLDYFKEYDRSEDYDENSNDLGDPSLANYSQKGQLLRRQTSYFIMGDANDSYFIRQKEIADAIWEYNQNVPIEQRKTIRFDYTEETLPSLDSFFSESESYSIYVDNSGLKRLFYVNDGKLFIKSSRNFIDWVYDVKDFVFHKNFLDDELNKGYSQDIRNIQIVRSYYDNDIISCLYTNNNMLFMRNLQSNLLEPKVVDGERDNTNVLKHLEVTRNVEHKPLFLMGQMPDGIKEQKQIELQEHIPEYDSELGILISYPSNVIEKFDENLAIDPDTQPLGYITRQGLLRIFYKNSLRDINSIIVDGFYICYPEIFYEPKDKFKNEG